MLGVLASIAFVVSGVSATMALTEEERLAAEESSGPVVEVRAAAAADTTSGEPRF